MDVDPTESKIFNAFVGVGMGFLFIFHLTNALVVRQCAFSPFKSFEHVNSSEWISTNQVK